MMTNKYNTVLYTGLTNELDKRAIQHKEGAGGEFTRKYKINKLVHVEVFDDVKKAIAREKQIKKWKREWKNKLIEENNSEWKDLIECNNLGDVEILTG